MSPPILGGPGPRIETIYHYSKTEIVGVIARRQFWTNMFSDDANAISRITGMEASRFSYRSEIKVNSDVIDGKDPWFTNRATTKWGTDEYQNEKAISKEYLVTTKLVP